MKPCCQDAGNRVAESTGQADLVCERCRVCGCRHFALSVDPVTLGVTGASLGRRDA